MLLLDNLVAGNSVRWFITPRDSEENHIKVSGKDLSEWILSYTLNDDEPVVLSNIKIDPSNNFFYVDLVLKKAGIYEFQADHMGKTLQSSLS
jgi:hypothetical protein